MSALPTCNHLLTDLVASYKVTQESDLALLYSLQWSYHPWLPSLPNGGLGLIAGRRISALIRVRFVGLLIVLDYIEARARCALLLRWHGVSSLVNVSHGESFAVAHSVIFGVWLLVVRVELCLVDHAALVSS